MVNYNPHPIDIMSKKINMPQALFGSDSIVTIHFFFLDKLPKKSLLINDFSLSKQLTLKIFIFYGPETAEASVAWFNNSQMNFQNSGCSARRKVANFQPPSN